MLSSRCLLFVAVFALGPSLAAAEPARSTDTDPIPAEQFDKLHALIRPQANEHRWTEIPWLTNLAEGRKKAAADGKPLLIVFTGGHALGHCGATGTSVRSQPGNYLARKTADIYKRKDQYVAVALNYFAIIQRTDGEGKFFKKLLPPNNKSVNEVLMATPNGKLVSDLEEWQSLPQAEREVGVELDDFGAIDPAFDVSPPMGGLILKVYRRAFAIEAKRKLYQLKEPVFGGPIKAYEQPLIDYLWLTQTEWRALLPAKPVKGTKHRVPAAITDRICRYSLFDSNLHTNPFKRDEVLEQELTLTVEDATAAGIGLSLQGTARFEIKHNPDAAKVRGEVITYQMLGRVNYDAHKQAFSRFNVVAVSEKGQWWRPGTEFSPMGIALQLARDDLPAERIPPGYYRDVEYGLRDKK